MTDIVFDVSKGRALAWGDAINDDAALVLILLQASATEDDSTLMKRVSIAEMLAHSTEQEMDRITISGSGSVTNIADTTEDAGFFALADPVQTWAASSGSTIGSVVIAYSPADAVDDNDRIPITKHDLYFVPDGTDLAVDFGAYFMVTT